MIFYCVHTRFCPPNHGGISPQPKLGRAWARRQAPVMFSFHRALPALPNRSEPHGIDGARGIRLRQGYGVIKKGPTAQSSPQSNQPPFGAQENVPSLRAFRLTRDYPQCRSRNHSKGGCWSKSGNSPGRRMRQVECSLRHSPFAMFFLGVLNMSSRIWPEPSGRQSYRSYI